ncbi:hypothetical protein N8016_03560 [Pelagibacteraceae bacterium]|nr:hypothetical protein [Pelagibacteraceae bacterium]
MPKIRKDKSKAKNNVVPFRADEKSSIEEEQTQRQGEQDRLNSILRDKYNEMLKIIDTSSIEKQWGLYALLFHAKQTAAFDLHPSEYVRANDASSKEIIKNQREYLEENCSEFINKDMEIKENNKKVLH